MVRHALPIKGYSCPAALSLMAIILVGGCAGGGGSSTQPPPTNPTPAITAISPSTLQAGVSGATVTISGSGFIVASVAQWNQNTRPTTFVSSTQLQVALTTADLATGSTGQITIMNPAPGGGASGASTLTVNNPIPALTGISPSSIT